MGFPFDERTLIGYAVADLMIGGTLYVICYTATSALYLISAVYVLGLTIIKDFRMHIQEFSEIWWNSSTNCIIYTHQL